MFGQEESFTIAKNLEGGNSFFPLPQAITPIVIIWKNREISKVNQ